MPPPASQAKKREASRRKQVNNDDDENCGTCKKHESQKAKGDKPEWIECDLCSVWYHLECQGLNGSDVEIIKNYEGLGVRWYCNKCAVPHDGNKQATKIDAADSVTISKLTSIEQMMTKFTQSYADALKKK